MTHPKLKQLGLLLWKNGTLQLRSYVITLVILGMSVGLPLFIVWARSEAQSEVNDEPINFPAFPVSFSSSPTLWPRPAFLSNQDGALRVYMYPDNDWTRAVAAAAGESTTNKETLNQTLVFEVTDDLDGTMAILKEQVWAESPIVGLVQFTNEFPAVGAPSDIDFTIRLSYSARVAYSGFPDQRRSKWQTGLIYSRQANEGPRARFSWSGAGPPGYLEEGFLHVQLAVNLGILVESGGGRLEGYAVQMRRIPYPPWTNNIFLSVVAVLIPLMLCLTIIPLVLTVVKQLVLEKERRLKESMKMMGLSPWLHNVAWFIHFGVIFCIVIVAVSVLFLETWVDEGPVFPNSSYPGLLLLLGCYSVQSLTVCFFLASIFKKASTAAVLTGLGWFISFFVYLFFVPGAGSDSWYSLLNDPAKFLVMFVPNFGLGFSVALLSELEKRGLGCTLSTLTEPRSYEDSLTLAWIFFAQILSAVLWFLASWYIDNVFPGEFGVAKKPWFLFTKSYWMPASGGGGSHPVDLEKGSLKEGIVPGGANFEEDPDLPVGISIINLKKTYGNGKVAVKGITTKMFKGQITAFLGHNGAGKTSTISMLTGLYEPSAGTAFINGLNIRSDMDGIRQSLGICPQHDVLYDSLSVRQHLWFFSQLKGADSRSIKGEMKELLADLQLSSKMDALASQLSGGMKRKLSVAIAFCAASNVVLLDEPTTGMDPSARRVTWDVIQKYRKGRTVILTTHYMDEADFLGDRIAIMSSGKLVCAGTSMFLKNRYGVGYHMVTEKSPSCNSDQVHGFIKKFVPGVEKESNVGSELTFRLPQDSSANFPAMFTALEKDKNELGILSYGVSVTTLEEVFLKVGHLNEDDEESHSYSSADTKPALPDGKGKVNKGMTNDELEAIESGCVKPEDVKQDGDQSFSTIPPFTVVERNSGPKLYLQQFKALIIKRVINTWRNRPMTIAQLAIPVLFAVFICSIIKIYVPENGAPALILDLDSYKDSKVAIFTRDPEFDGIVNEYKSIIAATSSRASTVDVASKTVALPEDLGKFSLCRDPCIADCPSGCPPVPTNNSICETELASEEDCPGEFCIARCELRCSYAQCGYYPPMVRYFSREGQGRIDQFNHENIIGVSFEMKEDGTKLVTAWFNGEPYHSSPLALQHVLSAIMRVELASAAPMVTVTNHPLPATLDEQAEEADQGTVDSLLVNFYLAGMGMGFLMASFSVFLIRERAVKSKHIQFVSGVHASTYWGSALVWDLLSFCVPCCLVMAVFLAFRVEAWLGERALWLLATFVLYGWAALPMMYALSYVSRVPPNGFLLLGLINVIGTIGFAMARLILKSLESDGIKVVEFIGFFCPQHQLVASIQDISATYLSSLAGIESSYLKWEEPGIGKWLTFLLIDSVIYWAVIFQIEIGIVNIVQNACCFACRMVKKKQVLDDGDEEVDSDILEERQRLIEGRPQKEGKTDTLIIRDVSKTYRTATGAPVVRAVKSLNLGIPEGECFGLLGVNGAGKSTTFSMLTGDILIEEGSATLNGVNIRTNIVKARQMMGYCPQFDALIDQMTGEETLYMYGRFRGVPEDKLALVVGELMDALQLSVYKDKACGTYSGGNKRKLSTAIALIGSPPITFLDEPSSGMDPVTRRRLWNVLSRVREDGRSIVITSHSMEECEALCTRLGVMVNGRLRCLGSLQRVKSRFGRGFTLICKTRSQQEPGSRGGGGGEESSPALRLKQFINDTYPESELKDEHIQGLTGYLHFELPSANQNWAALFETVERVKAQFCICDYVISQTTLEQIFLNFAREQHTDHRQN